MTALGAWVIARSSANPLAWAFMWFCLGNLFRKWVLGARTPQEIGDAELAKWRREHG